ncbi:MAG: hypothetical protein DMF76_26590 [Acidobacteria bacterium]|nr:MAG: hypothetical protein DMF76_26590 [Acidobacteriota bacterium]
MLGDTHVNITRWRVILGFCLQRIYCFSNCFWRRRFRRLLVEAIFQKVREGLAVDPKCLPVPFNIDVSVSVCRQNISDIRFDILRECLAHLV